jgi:DNA invertase Pin-like site-specific DNA recombinase
VTYELTVPNNRRNRAIMLAILANFAGIEAEFTSENAAEGITLATDSEATWAGALAAFEEGEPCAA